MSLDRRTLLLSGLAAPFALGACGQGGDAAATGPVRIGQATTSLSFLPIWAARAFDTFGAAGQELTWAAIPGGDPAALAALDAGDIDLAAVGSDTALAAIARGQPFVMVYNLMAKLSLELTVARTLIDWRSLSPAGPLAARLAALRGTILGVSAVGGAQDRALRWMAAQGGLDPGSLQIAQVGAPPAIQAALENGRIQGFLLSPPEAGIAEARGYGRRLIDPSKDFPTLRGLPFLVLVAKADADAATGARITRALGALQAASMQVVADSDAAADRIAEQFFPNIDQPIMRSAVRSMIDGLDGQGRLNPENIAALGRYSGGSLPAGDAWYTNRYFLV
jgi:NitT/TauT family transport system substrate-binding protein